MGFGPSVSQIFRRIFAPNDNAIQVQEVNSLKQASDKELQITLFENSLISIFFLNTHRSPARTHRDRYHYFDLIAAPLSYSHYNTVNFP